MTPQKALDLINPGVRNLKGYHLSPEPVAIKLNQNENPFDWPAQIKDEVAQFVRQRPWNRYPNFVPDTLIGHLAEYAGVDRRCVIVGNGSNEMLLVLLLSLLDRSKGAIICQPAFTVYNLLVTGLGSSEKTVFLNDDLSFNVGAICEAAQKNPGALMILTSPNNPTGTSLDEKDICTILDAHAGYCILDQAYVEFGAYSAIPLLKRYPNLIITRTFSKAMAGAGLRLGYMIGTAEIIAQINKIKLPYNINFFSEHVAETALRNVEKLREMVTLLSCERDALYDFLKKLPFDSCYPSCANFLLVRCARKQELFDYLKGAGILIRDVSSYPMLQNCLRISVGTPQENVKLMEAISRFFSR